MPLHHLAGRETSTAYVGLPALPPWRRLGDLAVALRDNRFNESIEETFCAAKVVVERHRLKLELGRNPPHRHRTEALGIGEPHGRGQHTFGTEGAPAYRISRRPCHGLTLYGYLTT